MRYLRLMFLLAQLSRLALLDTAPGTGGQTGGTGGTGGTGSAGGTGEASGSAAGDSSGGAGTGTAGAGGQSGQSGTGGASGGTGTGTAGSGTQGAAQGAGEAQNVADLPAWAQNVITEARKEAATNRVGRTAAETARTDALKALAATLGVDVTAGAPTAEQLQGTVQTLTGERDTALAQARSAQVQVAAIPVAAKHGADLAALMDSASFLAKLGQLDPAANDFAAQLDTTVKAAVDANPRLKAGQAPARGGFDPSGGPGGDQPATSWSEAINRRLAAPKS